MLLVGGSTGSASNRFMLRAVRWLCAATARPRVPMSGRACLCAFSLGSESVFSLGFIQCLDGPALGIGKRGRITAAQFIDTSPNGGDFTHRLAFTRRPFGFGTTPDRKFARELCD
ncbi:MAG: hypothetical protein WDM94_07230 [Bauldia sp.]